MREVTVDVAELLDIVRDNRETHRGNFEKAIEAWRRAVVAQLGLAVADAKAGRKYRTHFSLPEPQDHTEDYDDVIGMLEMHTEPTVKLETREFRRYVTDDWDWKAGFTETYNSYVGEAA